MCVEIKNDSVVRQRTRMAGAGRAMKGDLPLADELTAVFAGLSNVLLTEETVAHALKLITGAAVLSVDGAAGAGVTLIDMSGHRSSAASTDDIVAQADTLQYELGQGPCLSAWATGQPVDVGDVRTDPRWRQWGVGVDKLGLRSCVSVPLLSGDLAFGAIKVYWAKPHAATDRTIRLLELFAAQAAIFVANVQVRERGRMLSDQLKTTLTQRDTISTAKGIVMADRRVGHHEAMLYMMSKALEENRTLQEVAGKIIESTVRLDHDRG